MKKSLLFVVLVLLAFSCTQPQEEQTNGLSDVKSAFWTQLSAENEALYYQGYNLASERIRSYDPEQETLPPAVVLDIDETVLDNSPFTVYRAREGLSYTEDLWNEWCERREAGILPGVLAFTKLADSLGVEVFYISNRLSQLLDATIENMAAYGLPNSDSAHIFLKTSESSKDARRAIIREGYNILLLIGDNLSDFDGIFDDRKLEYGKQTVRDHASDFGTRYIILPNTMYGNWEKAAFPDGVPGEKEVLKVLKGYSH